MNSIVSCIIAVLANALFVIQSNAALIGTKNALSNSVISNYRIEPKDLTPERGLQLIKFLEFVPKQGNETVRVELHPNDDFALERCSARTLLYELINFQLQLYLSIEKTNFRSDLLPVCGRVEQCIGSMHEMASRSQNFQERLFSPVFLLLKQSIKLACNMQRKESKMNVNSIVDTTQALYESLMMMKNLVKTVNNIGLF